VRDWRTEEGHEVIAEELVDRALVAMHFGQRDLEKRVEYFVHALGAESLGECRRVCEVAEQRGDRLAFAFYRTASLENHFCGMRRGIDARCSLVSHRGRPRVAYRAHHKTSAPWGSRDRNCCTAFAPDQAPRGDGFERSL
jgi:hypothetical protein